MLTRFLVGSGKASSWTHITHRDQGTQLQFTSMLPLPLISFIASFLPPDRVNGSSLTEGSYVTLANFFPSLGLAPM